MEHIAKADLACAGASKILREEIGKRALLQLGITIPVYALTVRGKRLVLAYLADFKDKKLSFLEQAAFLMNHLARAQGSGAPATKNLKWEGS